MALDSTASESMRELASDLGVDVEPTGHCVLDHFELWPEDSSHRTVLAKGYLHSKALWGNEEPQARRCLLRAVIRCCH